MIMSQSTSEAQTPEITQRTGDNDAELSKAVAFATLISMSSLSTPDVQDDRLTGRKEIAARLAEQADAFGLEVPVDTSTPGTGDLDPIFECQVADELALRGHTFEAELRYRRLRRYPAVANRLALLLDAKGFHRESWQWYLRAARSNDIRALFRLATICWARGDQDWAMRLTKHAVAQLAPDAYNDLIINIDNLVRRRTTAFKLNDYLSVKPALDSKTSTDAVYTLGSVLLTLASRPDLARMAYCSALARGHPLAAVSLLDLAQAPTAKKAGSWRLTNMLQDGLNSDLRQYSPVADQSDDFDRALLPLKSQVQNETLEGLIQIIRAPTPHREEAIERIIVMTQLITYLHGYGRFGCDTRGLRYIDATARLVCGKVDHSLLADEVGDAASLINMIRDWSAQELTRYRLSEWRHSGSRRKKKQRAEDRRRDATKSSTIRRFGREYFSLQPKHREVLILHLAGLYSDEVAKVLYQRKVDTDQMFADAVTRLHEAQQGEQIPTGKLLDAEVDSCFSTDILELIASVRAWSDYGATFRPRLPNPTQLLNLQRVRRRRVLTEAHHQRT